MGNKNNSISVEEMEEIIEEEVPVKSCWKGGFCPTWDAAYSKPELALLVTGLISIVNSVMPVLLFYWWRFTTSKLVNAQMFYNPLFYHGWQIYWIINLALFCLPTFIFPLLYMEIDVLSHFYVWWFDFLLIGYWSIVYQVLMILLFMVAAIEIDSSQGISKLDAWLDFTIVFMLAGVTATC